MVICIWKVVSMFILSNQPEYKLLIYIYNSYMRNIARDNSNSFIDKLESSIKVTNLANSYLSLGNVIIINSLDPYSLILINLMNKYSKGLFRYISSSKMGLEPKKIILHIELVIWFYLIMMICRYCFQRNASWVYRNMFKCILDRYKLPNKLIYYIHCHQITSKFLSL